MADGASQASRHAIAVETLDHGRGFRCGVCSRPIVQYDYFRLMRDEAGLSLGASERVTAWRHKQAA